MKTQGYLGYAKQIRNIDYNDLRPENYTNGLYVISSNINSPFGEDWTYVVLLSFSKSSCIQIATGDANNLIAEMKIRTLVADVWGAWQSYVTNADFESEIVTAQFSDGVYVRNGNGNIKSGNYTVITVTQKYAGVKNVTLTADITSSGYAVYARNANDGSNYNGAISLYVFAAK